jgi:hypothetical protein
MWLEAPVEETDERGNKHRSTRNRDDGRGTPQGAPMSACSFQSADIFSNAIGHTKWYGKIPL